MTKTNSVPIKQNAAIITKKLLKKLSNLFFVNLGWKAVSLIIAAVIWFVVVNETNPTSITPTPYSVNLSIVNIEKITENGYVLRNEATLKSVSVDITIRGSLSDLNELSKKRGEMRAYIDFSPIDVSRTMFIGESQPITVKIELPRTLPTSRYQIINVSPSTVDVVFDSMDTREFNVSVDTIGEAAAGYVFLNSIAEPQSIEITGPGSVVETIAMVSAEVNLLDASDSFEGMATIKVLDGNSKDITSSLTLSNTQVHVSIPVHKYAKVPITEPPIFGTPANGYHVTKVEWTPQTLEIVGEEADVDVIGDIALGPISVEGITESFEETYDLRNNLLATGSNCNVRNGTPHEVTVEVTVEQEVEGEIYLRPDNIIRLSAPANYELEFTEALLTVSGIKTVLDNLTDKDVSAIIDMTGLQPGTYDLKAQIYLPASVSLTCDEPVIRVTVFEPGIKLNGTSTPTPDESIVKSSDNTNNVITEHYFGREPQ